MGLQKIRQKAATYQAHTCKICIFLFYLQNLTLRIHSIISEFYHQNHIASFHFFNMTFGNSLFSRYQMSELMTICPVTYHH